MTFLRVFSRSSSIEIYWRQSESIKTNVYPISLLIWWIEKNEYDNENFERACLMFIQHAPLIKSKTSKLWLLNIKMLLTFLHKSICQMLHLYMLTGVIQVEKSLLYLIQNQLEFSLTRKVSRIYCTWFLMSLM